MKSVRVFFLNRFYWPDEPATAQLLTDLATALAARGHDVTVIASRGSDSTLPERETRDGVTIERVRTTRWGRRSVPGRIADFATFYPGALWRLLRLARRGDTVVALTDPPLLGVFVCFVAWIRHANLIHWVQDIYPDVAADLTGQRWLMALRPMRNFAWRWAKVCVVPGHDMAALLAAAGVAPGRIVVSPNWAPAGLRPPSASDVAALRMQWELAGKFIVGYSGNLGRVHDLDPLLEVAAALNDDPAFAFVFIGEGARRASLEAAARARGLRNVHFRPPQPRGQLAITLGVADVHFVTLRPGAERHVFPSKLYGIAQVGRPVLFVGRHGCEVARTVQEHGFGAAFTREETGAIAETIRQLRADPGRLSAMQAAAVHFAPHGFDDAVENWHRLISAGLADVSHPL